MLRVDYTGRTIGGRYRITALLGKGGMGAVYLAHHTVIGKRVAVKFLHADLAESSAVVKRFYREAQAAAAIAHKNIIDVMDVGVSDENDPYLVMEYLEGESLAEMLQRTGPIDLAAACGILEPTLLALQAAHDQGIIHRDLKPENIFMVHRQGEPPAVKIIDFGISKFTGQTDQSQLTQTGSMLGTPAYMSPEQIRGDKGLDHRSDLYAIGVILYEMLTGTLPFNGEHYNALLISILTEEPTFPKDSYAGFPNEAEALLMRCLNKDPSQRPQTASKMLDDIRQLAEYEHRQAHLSQYVEGATIKGFAGGDLGSEISTGTEGKKASEVLLAMGGEPTAGEWSGTLASSRKWIGITGIAALALIAIAAAWLLGTGNRAPTPIVTVPLTAPDSQPLPPATPEEESVRIEVVGLPEGAEIFYGKAPLPRNPFEVAPSKNMTQLKVVTPGYSDFVTWIVPDRNQTVEAKLTPATPKEPTKTGERAANAPKRKSRKEKAIIIEKSPKENAAAPGETQKEKQKKTLQRGGRDIKFTEDFN